MLARIRKAMDDKESGFTLIELLVVMIIIGILAAIAIPVFLNQRQSAFDASVKSDIRQLATDAESIYTDTQAYPVSGITLVAGPPRTYTLAGSSPIRVSAGNVFTYVAATTPDVDAFCLTGTNPKGNRLAANPFVYISTMGGMQPAATVACPPAAGTPAQWGL